MRIEMVMTVLAPIGGIESSTVPLCLALRAAGHEINLYTARPVTLPNQNAAALDEAGIRRSSAPGWLARLADWGAPRQDRLVDWLSRALALLLGPLVLVSAVGQRRGLRRAFRGVHGRLRGALAPRLDFRRLYYHRLKQQLRRQPPDVIHVHGWGCGEDPPGGLAFLRRTGHPLVYTEHNSPDSRRLRPIVNAPLNQADILIAVSAAGKAGLLEVGGARRPIIVIPYSVAPLPPAPAGTGRAPGITITCVARFMPQKAHDVLLAAMAQVAAAEPAARLLLAGSGPLEPALLAQAASLGISDRVHFLGVVTRPDLPALLAQTDIFVLASHWEGLPVALIEALSAGKALVVSNVGGNPELVTDGENGLVVPPGDAAALAAALLSLAGDPARRAAMAAASRQRFASGGFQPADIARRTLLAYDEAIRIHR